eukprot:1992440-Prorocentrum_lima.AAC.1
MVTMNTFHLKGLRKILGWVTTYVEPQNTNERVYAEATRRVRLHTTNHQRRIRPMTTVYKERKVKQLMEVLIAGPGRPHSAHSGEKESRQTTTGMGKNHTSGTVGGSHQVYHQIQ